MTVFKCTSNQNIPPSKGIYFKEEEISEVIKVPSSKPNIKQILSVVVSPEVKEIKVVKIEVGRSNEGKVRTGTKLIIKVNISEKINYMGDNLECGVYSIYSDNIKSISIMVPDSINEDNVCDLVRGDRYNATAYVESIDTRLLNERNIFKSMLLLVDVKFC